MVLTYLSFTYESCQKDPEKKLGILKYGGFGEVSYGKLCSPYKFP
jgi:hypothetical protein